MKQRLKKQTNKIKSWFFEKIKKINKSLARLNNNNKKRGSK